MAMKIIKVVHGNSPQEIEVEKTLFALQDYSADTFLETYGEKLDSYNYFSEIISKSSNDEIIV